MRDVVALGKVEFVHCPTEEMLADPLTKPLDRIKFEKLVKAMGVTSKKILSSFDRGGSVVKCRISEGTYHIDPKIPLSDLD